MTLQNVLKKVPFFTQLQDDQIESLIRIGKTASYPANSYVFREGDESDSMYVVVTGRVRIYKQHENGKEVDLSLAEHGDFFGEFALLDSNPRSATAITLTDCALFTIDQLAFTTLILKSRSQVVFRLFKALTERLRDTSERYLKEELARSQMEVEQHRALSQMVAGVAHEINTPLGTINTAASIIANGLRSETLTALAQDRKSKSLIEDMLEAAQLLERNVQRAHKLTQDFKKISVSQLSDQKDKLDIVEVITSVIDLFKINARKAKIEVQLINQVDNPTWEGYRGYLTQVILNLLTNVERYAYPDGAGGKVDVTISAEGSNFVLRVQDYGRGIPPENLPKIFEPFFTTGRIKGGTGLGMAIVHNIVVEAMQGTININSVVDQGTMVTVVLPKVVSG